MKTPEKIEEELNEVKIGSSNSEVTNKINYYYVAVGVVVVVGIILMLV